MFYAMIVVQSPHYARHCTHALEETDPNLQCRYQLNKLSVEERSIIPIYRQGATL